MSSILLRNTAIFLFILSIFFLIHDYRSQDAVFLQDPYTSKRAVPAENGVEKIVSKVPAEVKPAVVLVKGSIKSGETFSHALERNKLDRSVKFQVINGLSEVINFRKCMPGDSFYVSVDSHGKLIRCTYEKGPFEVYALERDPDSNSGFHAFRDSILMERRVKKLSGIIHGSLFSSFSDAGGNVRLTMAFAELFASQIDFNTEIMPDDRFDLIVEEYFKDGRFLGYGRILAARYKNHCQELDTYYFTPDGQNSGNYYNSTGRESGTSFLKSPLPMYRVTSKFTKRRMHPILKVYRPHYGVDMAAPTGTRVMAVADGEVSFAGWQKGFGRTVTMKHPGGYKTYYGHLSRYGKGIKKGVQVEQKQIIGYVGSSGLSTGPHLDYRIKENGVFKNPFSIKFKPKSRLSGKALDVYLAKKNNFERLLKDESAPETLATETTRIKEYPDGWLG